MILSNGLDKAGLRAHINTMSNEYFDGEPQVGGTFSGRVISGWNRINTSSSGRRYVGFGEHHSEITIRFTDGTRKSVVMVERERRSDDDSDQFTDSARAESK